MNHTRVAHARARAARAEVGGCRPLGVEEASERWRVVGPVPARVRRRRGALRALLPCAAALGKGDRNGVPRGVA